jgi:hypothetical protein
MSIFLVSSNLVWEYGQPSLHTDYATGNTIQVLIPGRGKRFISSSKMIRPAVGPIQPPTQQVSMALPLPQEREGLLGQSLKLTVHHYVLPRIGTSGAIPPLPLHAFKALTGKTL